MNLNEAQRQRVTAWILQGAKLSEIQTRLADEFGLRLTYMDVQAARGRFKADAKRSGAAEGHDPNRRHANNRRTTTACREKSLPDTRHATASHRRRVRHRGSTGPARCNCQRQGHVQRRPDGGLVSRPNGAARGCAQATRLQTVRCRRAAVSSRVAKRTRAHGSLICAPSSCRDPMRLAH